MKLLSFMSEMTGLTSNTIAMDLGTVNTLVASGECGIVLNERSVVAVSSINASDVFAVGNEALNMCGRTPEGVVLKYPFKSGVIADYLLAEFMMKEFIDKAMSAVKKRLFYSSPRVILCVPGCITQVERRALDDSIRHAGAKTVVITDEVMAAAIGAGLPVEKPVGSMIIDIGGGTTDAAVIALGGIAVQRSIRVGGNNIDNDIASHVRKNHNVLIGIGTAERLKIQFSTNPSIKKQQVTGLSLKTNLPCGITVTADEITEAISHSLDEIITTAKEVLSITPPELAGDVFTSGITLSGGGARLMGLADKLSEATEMPVRIAEKPLECVIRGALKMESIAGATGTAAVLKEQFAN